jgi:hypothetical protein
LSSRRYSTIRPKRATAPNLPIAPKSLELEQRVSRVEVCCSDVQEQLAVTLKRLAALQAQLDHFIARMDR